MLRRLFSRKSGGKLNLFRLLFWSLPVILSLLVVWKVTWPAWEELSTQRSLLEKNTELFFRYQERLTKDKPRLEKELAKINDLNQVLFVGLDPYVIVSELEKLMNKIPELSLRSFRISKRDELVGKVEKVRLSLVLEGDIKGLLSFLEALEKDSRALKITRLVINSRRHRRMYGLRVNMDLVALYTPKAL